jgi:p-hydroxybenzoate 3-monooxygenase
VRTKVGIVGAGPAGLLLSHLLHLRGIDSIVVDNRSRAEIEGTIRAGVLEQCTVDLLSEAGLGERLARDAFFHRGIYLRFGGRTHHIDMQALTGGSLVTIYPQHVLLKDLIAARLANHGDIRFGVADALIEGLAGDRPSIRFVHEGMAQTIECELIAGCDGAHGICRSVIPEDSTRRHERTYPFGWLGVLVEAPPSSDELVYAAHARGFALLSTRSATLQRMYLQCDPGDAVGDWPDDRIWEALHTRTAADGWRLHEGPITHKIVVPMRSFVCEPMQYRRLFLAGDAAHVVPPTGAKGLNLAVADARVLAHAIDRHARGDCLPLENYSATCLPRVWKSQRFSWWMTTLLHRSEGESSFDEQRRLAELEYLVSSRHASAALAENYVGLPFEPLA